jgi:putative ABC transport system ATP-binding protein
MMPQDTEKTDDCAAVQCRDVRKTYVTGKIGTPALRGVNLTVKRGELLMLVGPSGSGKTTLISIIAGVLAQDQGDCAVFNRSIQDMPPAEIASFRGATIGFVFQAYNLIPTLNARENVAVPLLIAGMRRQEAFSRADEMLLRVNLWDRLESFPRDLSGGQQQRVAIARALVHRPSLVVCDEPTAALDQDTGHHIMTLFKKVAVQEKLTLIVVTHDVRIFSFADRIAYMNDGVIKQLRDSASMKE